jgi:ABC-type transport system involved in multi-copper enzyme maturation permease subunit
MNRILGLALNTFRETIRDRILYAILVFALLMIASTLFLGSLTIGQDVKILLDVGLAAIELFAVAIAIFVGTSLLHKELDKRTVFIVLTKPVTRWQFLLGKFLGLAATLGILLLLMGGAFIAMVAWRSGSLPPGLVAAIGMIGLQLALLVALSLFFSTFTSPVLSMILTFCLYVIGHNTENLRFLSQKAGGAARWIGEGLYVALPNLSTFDMKNVVVYGATASMGQWTWAIVYGGLYAAALLAVAGGILERREF